MANTANITISLFNDSTALTDEQVADIVPALQTQVLEHFGPAWGVDAQLVFVPKNLAPAPGSWWLTFLDDSDQAGALGYHDLTPDGLPTGKIFVKTDIDNHLSWSVTASHELLEMLADPYINLTVLMQNGTGGKLYPYEVCDAVEDDQFGYAINGVMVSNFVLPAYFEPKYTGPAPAPKLDYKGILTAPVPALLSGGYIGVFAVHGGGGWTQITAQTEGQPHRGHLRSPLDGSRSQRRRKPRGEWRKFEPTRLVPMRLVPMDPPPTERLVPMHRHDQGRLVPMRLVPMDPPPTGRLVPMDPPPTERLVPMRLVPMDPPPGH